MKFIDKFFWKYQYRNFPKDVVPRRSLFAITGYDLKSDKSGILEYCVNRADARYLMDLMRADNGRFDSLSIDEPMQIETGIPISLSEILHNHPSILDKDIKICCRTGAMFTTPVIKYTVSDLYPTKDPYIILETSDYNPSQTRDIHY